MLESAPAAHKQTAATTSPPSEGTRPPRYVFLDFLRAVSAHLIVWHHLVYYGPLSDVAEPLWPGMDGFFHDYGRNAVQVFLVLGGFVTALSLGKRSGLTATDAGQAVLRRYLRIGGPYLCLLVIAVGANWLADQWMDHESISALPTLASFLAHTVFLHDILGYEPLSAGIWYLAVDFQIFLLVVGAAWLTHRLAAGRKIDPVVMMQCLIWPAAMASLFWFNRRPEWEPWWLFFFGSYACGLLTAWSYAGRLPGWVCWCYYGLMVCALVQEFRPRLMTALATGVVIHVVGRAGWLSAWPTSRVIAFTGASSYSLFLIHFPVCLVVNAFLSQYVLDSPALCLAGLVLAYLLSVLASIAFYISVERAFQSGRAVAG